MASRWPEAQSTRFVVLFYDGRLGQDRYLEVVVLD